VQIGLPGLHSDKECTREAQGVHGIFMMTKEEATKMRQFALTAVEQLSDLLYMAKDRCSPEEYELIRRGVGLSIGRIQTEVLDVIYAAYPELDHLK